MNLFYRSLVTTALALLVFDFGTDDRRRVTRDCSAWEDGRRRSTSHRRNKRVYEGTVVKDGEFPYVVFMKSIIRKIVNNIEKCEERLCTGTLVHPRFVVTTRYCVEGNTNNVPKVFVFMIKRPYDEIKENMTYRTADQITYENGKTDSEEYGLVTLVRLNASFESVKLVANLWRFEPMRQPEELVNCHTVGFSLIARTDLNTPPDELLKPVEYVTKAKLDMNNCIVLRETLSQHAYLCNVSPNVNDPKAKSLCEGGDEGSPLLCKATAYQKEDEQRIEASTYKPPVDRGEYYIYGLANNVAHKVDCDHPKDRQNVLFVYTVRSGVWITTELEYFDLNDTKDHDYVATDTTSSKPTTTTVTSNLPSAIWNSTTTQLPVYYDTDDYDTARKKPMRQCKGGGRVNQDVHGSSLVVHNRVVVEDARWSASDPPTRRGAAPVTVVVSCVYHYYFYYHHCNNLLVPPRATVTSIKYNY